MVNSAYTCRWEYTFCPFQNATQKRVAASGSRPVVIGLWGDWQFPNEESAQSLKRRFLHAHYGDGGRCGSGNRDLQVEFVCESSEPFGILSADEDSTCRYKMRSVMLWS